MNFKPVTPFVQKEFSKYESLRSIYMSEGAFSKSIFVGELLSHPVCHG